MALSTAWKRAARLFVVTALAVGTLGFASVPASALVCPAGSTARSVTLRGIRETLGGADVYKYYLRMDYCYNATQYKITSRTAVSWGTTHWPGWTYQGQVAKWQLGCTGCSFYELQTQGYFRGEVSGVTFGDSYPTLKIRIYGNGAAYGWGTGFHDLRFI